VGAILGRYGYSNPLTASCRALSKPSPCGSSATASQEDSRRTEYALAGRFATIRTVDDIVGA
jgi:hypothetical protein